MSNGDSEGASLGETLLARGWRQGAVCEGPALMFAWNAEAADASAGVAEVRTRAVKGRERLVVASQDCDIVSEGEQFVEFLICSREKRQAFLREIDRNSARWFVIDPQAGLVAQAKYRLAIAKDLLLTMVPESWPGTPLRLRRFVRWLARRYDRPAIPDPIVECFQDPIAQALVALDEAEPETMEAFGDLVRECRVHLPSSEAPPYDLHLVMLAGRQDVSIREADALVRVEEAIRQSLDGRVNLLSVRLVSDTLMSVAEYEATRPLYLEHFTYRGDELGGIEPSRSAS